MEFIFQQPGTSGLLAAIDDAAANAHTGGGVFAFASKGGIDALFECPNITHMLANGHPFHLIVGVDAITNAEALLCLNEKLALFLGLLSVDIFFHEHPSSTFHPKFSWFQQDDCLRLITGSGNLTLRGLGRSNIDYPLSGNWEAFSVQSLTGDSAIAVHKKINDWLAAQRDAGTLLSHDDERVRERAMANGRMRFSSSAAKVAPAPLPDLIPTPEAHATLIDEVILDTPEVLVREIPRNRTGQADVGRNALEEFFGYEGEEKSVFVQHVSLDNALGPADSILLFVNQSSNYRLELRAIAELEYTIGDDDSRMILVATKLDRRSFRYTIVPVTDDDYSLVSGLLGAAVVGRRRKMREERVSPEELRGAWPRVPSNLLPVEQLMPEP